MKTELYKEYSLSYLEKIFPDSEFRFEGNDLYDENEPSEFLVIDDAKETYIWSGHIEASGATYKRVD